jgi:hypothetical protein
MPKPPLGQRFRDFPENNTVLGVFFFVSLFLSSSSGTCDRFPLLTFPA